MTPLGFGKKKKDAAVEAGSDQADEAEVKAARKKEKKPQEKLSSVISESVPAAAVDLLKQNKPFVFPDGNSWAVLVLSAEQIGGLGKKHGSDEAKGSIIELIESDRIQTVVTAEMLQEDFLGIIPNTSTLERVDEYHLLTSAPYYWARAVLDDSGEQLVVSPVADAVFDEANAVAHSRKSLAAVIPEVWSWIEEGSADSAAPQPLSNDPGADHPAGGEGASGHGETAREADGDDQSETETDEAEQDQSDETQEGEDVVSTTAQTEAEAEVTEEPDEGVDYQDLADDAADEGFDAAEEPFDPDEFVAEEADQPVQQTQAAAVEEFVDEEAGDEDDYEDEDVDGYQEYIDANASRVVTEEEVRGQIARRFLSDDLDLTVTLDEFEATFATDSPVIQIDVAEDPSDWLGSQVAQLTRQANAEIAKVHQDNVDTLREAFITTMGTHVEAISKEVSPHREDSTYYAMSVAADAELKAAQAGADEERAKRARELVDFFEKQADERGEQARVNARAGFVNSHRAAHEERLASISREIQNENEEVYHQRRQTMLERRRLEAQRRLDYGITHVLSMLVEKQEQQRVSEHEVMQKWNNKLLEFIDENRKADIARADTLADQLARDTSVADLKAEHQASTEQLRYDYEERLRQSQVELDRAQENSLAELAQRESQWQHELSIEREKTRSADELASSLREQMSTMHESVEDQWSARVANLESDKQSYSDELERMNHIQSRSNKILLVLVILMAIAALMVGLVIGFSLGLE